MNVVDGAASVRAVGIGVVWPNLSGGRLTTPLAGTTKGSDSPDTVSPLITQVTLARTGPKLAGTLGSTHEPSAFCVTERFRTLTVQFEPPWASAGEARHTTAAVATIATALLRVVRVHCLMVVSVDLSCVSRVPLRLSRHGLDWRRERLFDEARQHVGARHAVDALAVHEQHRAASNAALLPGEFVCLHARGIAPLLERGWQTA